MAISRSPVSASFITTWPAATTWPASALTAVTTPSAGATSVAYAAWLRVTESVARACSRRALAAFIALRFWSSADALTNFWRNRFSWRSNSARANVSSVWAAATAASCACACNATSAGSSRASGWPRRTNAPRSTLRSTSFPAMRKARSASWRGFTSPANTAISCGVPTATFDSTTGRTGSGDEDSRAQPASRATPTTAASNVRACMAFMPPA